MARPSRWCSCALCAGLPLKLIVSSTGGGARQVPAQVAELLPVVTLGDSRLLRCPRCGARYFFSHEHQERDTCTQESTDITLRRYGPEATRLYLERAIAGAAAPLGVGQFARALLDGDVDEAVGESAVAADPAAAARRALAELEAGLDDTVAGLTAALRGRRPAPHLLAHAVEALCSHLARHGGWAALRGGLFEHRSPRVRLAAAALLVDIGLGNQSTFDLVHTPAPVRDSLARALAQPEQVAELTRLLETLARRPPTEAWDHAGPDPVRSDSRTLARRALALLARAQPAAG